MRNLKAYEKALKTNLNWLEPDSKSFKEVKDCSAQRHSVAQVMDSGPIDIFRGDATEELHNAPYAWGKFLLPGVLLDLLSRNWGGWADQP